jgi:ABC-type glycerol-3-phosphate transport system substrate-binding protein
MPDIGKIMAPESMLKCDFTLFGTNPVSAGIVNNSSPFMDISELTKEIRKKSFFNSAFVYDHNERMWGISPSLTPVIMFRNRKIDSSQCLNKENDWNWQEFKKYTETIRAKHPELPYICFFRGYMNYLFHNGVSLIDPATGKVKLDPAQLRGHLEFLRDMVKNKIMPIYSDVYSNNLFEQLYANSKVVVWEGWLSQLNTISKIVKDFDIMPTPAAPGCKRSIYSEIFCIMANSMNYNTCWDFIKYALSPEIQQHLADMNVNFPARKGIKPKIFSDAEFKRMTDYIEKCTRSKEKHHIPIPSTLTIETGIDRWIKHGGSLENILMDLENSCNWHIDNKI